MTAQYGAEVASVYDSLIAPAMPLDEEIARLRPHLEGNRVLEVGVGTGRVATAAAPIAESLVGVDNSAPMLDAFRAKGVPANVELLEADFLRPLPFGAEFATAYSTMGSLACVRTRDELVTALSNIRAVLRPGGVLLFEYYSTAAYRPLVEAGTITVPTPHHGGTSTFTTTLDAASVLTMHTRVDAEPAPPVAFSEHILFIERDEVEACLEKAGFGAAQFYPAEGMQPYDWYHVRSEEW
ncbi:class I SAM-dependent methyltransferase [Actinoplanes bogorensis]|uniref:Class I SAM-dependent methyltransferase n=1 Tax=Paractinoplanes bogorensis TaxID=1610840 RepID=A0ABS5YQQ1_9ACTN|nr:class I SAM-dependent methyltransferase [Actinoplanes bogorensis]MBU2665785.1 class I SAM-dependent methyltransferase [Actinoplanes bogorensis]